MLSRSVPSASLGRPGAATPPASTRNQPISAGPVGVAGRSRRRRILYDQGVAGVPVEEIRQVAGLARPLRLATDMLIRNTDLGRLRAASDGKNRMNSQERSVWGDAARTTGPAGCFRRIATPRPGAPLVIALSEGLVRFRICFQLSDVVQDHSRTVRLHPKVAQRSEGAG